MKKLDGDVKIKLTEYLTNPLKDPKLGDSHEDLVKRVELLEQEVYVLARKVM